MLGFIPPLYRNSISNSDGGTKYLPKDEDKISGA